MIESRRTIERQHERREEAIQDAWLESERQWLADYIERRNAGVAEYLAEDERHASVPWWKRAWLWLNE